MVSVLVPPPSAVVPSCASCASLAPSGRWSSPTSRMFWSVPSKASSPESSIASTWFTPETKRW
jgi:hypothetical protein